MKLSAMLLLLGAIMAAIIASTSAYNETMCLGERTLWLDEYARWHKANRGQPGARYLVYYCGPGQNLCAGTGDRIRGMLYMLRAAAVNQRVFLAVWAHPAPLTTFFDVNEIDWRSDGLPADVTSMIGKEHNGLDDGGWFGAIEYGHNKEKWEATKVHTTTAWPASIVDHQILGTDYWTKFGNGFHTLLGPLGGVPPDQEAAWLTQFTWYIDISSCWFHYAFKFSAAVETRTREQLALVMGSGTWSASAAGYVAWHWRTGGQHGEGGLIRAENKVAFRPRMQQLMSSVNCLRDMVRVHNILSPMLLVTDLNPMRAWVKAGSMGTGMVAMPSAAQHIDMGGGHPDLYLDVFVDALAVSRARCVLISQSGFSNTALMMSKTPLCYQHMDSCIHQQEAMFAGVSIR